MKRTLTIFLLFFLGMQISFAQGRVVTGVVTNAADGTTLPGVTILVKGTTTGVTTDMNGAYQIMVPNANSVLEFSFIGFKHQNIAVGQNSTLNVALELDLVGLEEVVVIGYGTSTKEALTGAVEVVGSEKFDMVPVASLESSLQGNVVGLQMNANDGQPGAATQVRIRGIGSINASSAPLYVIDGIPVQTGADSETGFDNGGRSSNVMSTINPNDIESLSVLKDASATAIYGSRGANGVILITTKGGKSGKAKINFSAQTGFSDPAYNGRHEPLTGPQFTTLYLEGYMNKGETLAQAQSRFDNLFPVVANTNWLDEIMRTGITQQYNVDVSGGANGISYFASAGYFDQEGILIGTDFTRFSSRLNIKAEVTDKLTITNNITVGRTESHGTSDGTAWDNPMYGAYLVPSVVPVYDDQGRFYADHQSIMGASNPVGRLLEDERWQKQTRILDNLSASYKIRENLTFKSAWSFDLIGIHEFEFENGRYGDGRRVGGRSNEASINSTNWIGTQTLNYNTIFGDDHSFDALIGYEAQKYDRRAVQARGEGFPNPTLRTLASAANPTLAWSSGTQYSFASMFSRFSYNYQGKYYATASFRRDGSSRFGEDSRWGNFWSVGGSWRVIQEDFMADINWVNDMKLRVSYGITGNASIGNFDAMALYGFGYDYAGIAGSAPSNIGNPALTWEGQSTLDIGIDLFLFDRLSTTITYFNRKNTDLLLDRPLSTTTGFSSNTQNVGDMQNSGIEIEANASIIKTADFSWDLGFNITMMKNEVTRLDEPILDGAFNREEGRDYYEFYMWHWAGVDPATGRGTWYTDESMTTTTTNVSDADRWYTGKSATPKAFGGINTNISYKGFNLSAQIAFVLDKYIYDVAGFVLDGDGRYTPRSTTLYAFENRWQNPGDESLYPMFYWGNTTGSNSKYQTRYLYDATYARLRDLTLSYTFGKSVIDKLDISSLKVFMKGNNLLTWVRDKDLKLDPEASVSGLVDGLQPKIKSITFGVNVGF